MERESNIDSSLGNFESLNKFFDGEFYNDGSFKEFIDALKILQSDDGFDKDSDLKRVRGWVQSIRMSKVKLDKSEKVVNKSLTAYEISTAKHLEYGPAPEDMTAFLNWVKSFENGKIGHFIDGKWVKPDGATWRQSVAPSNYQILAETIDGTSDDVKCAVAAAKKAQPGWAALPPYERAKYLYSIARLIQKHARLLTICESLDNGKTFRESRTADIPMIVRWWYHHAGWAQLMEEEMADYKPVGVCGAVVAFDFSLMLICWKLCPALAMGNTIVVKPSTPTRLTGLMLASIIAEANLPPGVVNIVTCVGSVGLELATHPDIDKFTFTGSVPTGTIIRKAISGSGKKISLELGGKSPLVVFDSADIDSAVEGVVDAIWFNQGQIGPAGSRLLVQENVEKRMIMKLKARMNKLRLGHSLEKNIDMGPLVTEQQYITVKRFCDNARLEGCDVYHAEIPIPEVGYYFPPTLITGCSTTSECVREEIFGPVLTVMAFRTPEEAIELANNTKFGLTGSVWSENVSLALEVAMSLKVGVSWINSHNLFDAAANFGGIRESGFGREGGREGLLEFVRPKWQPRIKTSIKLPVADSDIVWPKYVPPAIVSNPIELKEVDKCGYPIDKTAKVYYGGAQKRPDGQYSRGIFTPSGELITHVPEGNRKDIRNAMEAALKGYAKWGKRAAFDRSQICFFIAENLSRRFEEFAKRIQLQTGRDIANCELEVHKSIERLFYYAGYADKYGGSMKETPFYGVTMHINEPVGVIAVLCPEEYPLLGFISTVIPPIIRGNAVLALPSQKHPLSATDLYQVLDTSDLPGGVLNIVTGERDHLAKTIVEHQEIDSIWYFGSAEVSRNIEYTSCGNMKRSFVDYGIARDWMDDKQGQGKEFLDQSVEPKNIWIPMGECK